MQVVVLQANSELNNAVSCDVVIFTTVHSKLQRLVSCCQLMTYIIELFLQLWRADYSWKTSISRHALCIQCVKLVN